MKNVGLLVVYCDGFLIICGEDNKLRVRYKGVFSRDFHATSSVPQGSILGPPLFNAYSSMICVTVGLLYRSLQFADDLKLYFKICSEDDLDLLQECL